MLITFIMFKYPSLIIICNDAIFNFFKCQLCLTYCRNAYCEISVTRKCFNRKTSIVHEHQHIIITTLPLSHAHTTQERRQIRTNCSPLANYLGQATSSVRVYIEDRPTSPSERRETRVTHRKRERGRKRETRERS